MFHKSLSCIIPKKCQKINIKSFSIRQIIRYYSKYYMNVNNILKDKQENFSHMTLKLSKNLLSNFFSIFQKYIANKSHVF